MQKNEIEFQRAEYYKKNLKQINVLYEPALQLHKEIDTFSDSMVSEFVLSPFLTLFTIWVLRSAERDGVMRLYFLARDGYPAYQIARKFCKAFKIDIECKYLYCSRYSLRTPMYSENIEEMLEYICRSGIDVTQNKVFKRAGLQDSQIKQLEQNDLSLVRIEEALSYTQLSELKQSLRKNTRFIKLATENSRTMWEALRAYFAQEGLNDDIHIGLVDSGWIGSTQKSVYDILKRMGKSANIDGYYWGLYDIPYGVNLNKYHSFLFDKKKGMKNKLFFSNCLIETIFSNTHGTTVSYEEKKEEWIPVLQQKSMNTEFVNKLNKLLESYSDIFVRTCSQEIFDGIDLEGAIKKLSKSLLRFMYNPTIGEAEVFGKLQFSDDLLDDNCRELGPIFSTKEMKENCFLNRILNALHLKNSIIHESAWFYCTVRRSANNAGWHRGSYMAYRLLSYLKKSL